MELIQDRVSSRQCQLSVQGQEVRVTSHFHFLSGVAGLSWKQMFLSDTLHVAKAHTWRTTSILHWSSSKTHIFAQRTSPKLKTERPRLLLSDLEPK